MSSILTNSSAMVALETLRSINKSLGQVQSEISTGKKVSNAKDNAAVYAISTVMSSDVASFDKISDSLNLGSATVGVARAASEQIVDILTQMKGLIVSAQEENVDRSKIQTDVSALRDQIATIVGSAQFNGSNLVKGTDSVNFLASLDRASDGTVTASNITVGRNDLTTSVAVVAATDVVATEAGFTAASSATIAGGASETVTFTAGTIAEGDIFSITVGGTSVTYTASATDTLADVGAAFATSITALDGDITATFAANADPTGTDSVLTIASAADGQTLTTQATQTGAVAAGGLLALTAVDVSTGTGAASALGAIDALLTTAIDAASAFGSSQKRIDTQSTFVDSLMDSMKVGIGALVDADLEEASARLQSLQVQQQLGVQALSIANQAPQSLLSLFR
ncbi:MAG: flagellin [Robiginitomaculum sp.]|nr:flagellin [Robiginitomaculum sp.]